MQTPWGEVPVLDSHLHFFSHRFFTLLAAQKPGLAQPSAEAATSILGWDTPPPEPVELGRGWAQELDRHGVERAAIIASLPGDEDSVVRAATAFPDRFYGYFMLNPCAPDALERAGRVLSHPVMRGICLFPAMHGYPVNADPVRAVLDLATQRQGTLVFVHCGVLTVGARKKLGIPSPFDMRYSNPIDLHPTALRYPNLPFVVPHFGAGFLREALMLCDLCPNVYLDTSSSNSWTRYHAPAIQLKDVFARALNVAGPRRLLFGTDSSYFPRGWHAAVFEQQVEALSALAVSGEHARDILGGNLRRLLG
jgi:hypothetical protein